MSWWERHVGLMVIEQKPDPPGDKPQKCVPDPRGMSLLRRTVFRHGFI